MARKATMIAPVQNIHGYFIKTDGSRFDKKKYGGAPKWYGFVRHYGTKQMFGVRVKVGMTYKTAANEQAAHLRQLKFRSVAMATHERITDPNQKTQDQLAFRAQSKYATMWGFIFKQEWDAYEG